MLIKKIKGRLFKKSSFSKDDRYCVGVHVDRDKIYVTNTNSREGVMCCFTAEEWRAFVKGVKNDEFDV